MENSPKNLEETLQDLDKLPIDNVLMLGFDTGGLGRPSKIDISGKIFNILNLGIKSGTIRHKILLYSFFSKQQLLNKYSNQALEFFGHNSTGFIQLPYSQKELDEAISNIGKLSHIDGFEVQKAIAQNAFLRAREIKHYFKFDSLSKYENLEQAILAVEGKDNNFIYSSAKSISEHINELKIIFPSLKSKSPIQILERLANTNFTIPEVAKGQFFPGVYVDIDGTLFERVAKGSNQEGSQIINEELLQKLQEYEKQGKEIYIFTGGNLKEKQKLLDKFDIKYKLMSKYDMAGGTAEIVYDDTGDKDIFFAETKILAKEYNNVKRFIRSDT